MHVRTVFKTQHLSQSKARGPRGELWGKMNFSVVCLFLSSREHGIPFHVGDSKTVYWLRLVNLLSFTSVVFLPDRLSAYTNQVRTLASFYPFFFFQHHNQEVPQVPPGRPFDRFDSAVRITPLTLALAPATLLSSKQSFDWSFASLRFRIAGGNIQRFENHRTEIVDFIPRLKT